jgi:tetratricopeptide (TPR) repeat protein
MPHLLRLWYRPSAAMSEILDRGSLLFASVAVLLLTAILKSRAPWLAAGFFMPLLVLAVVYVPGVLLLVTAIGRLGTLSIVFQRDYSPLLTCTAMALAAALIPVTAGALVLEPAMSIYILAPAVLYFALLMFFAVRVVFGVDNGVAAGVVALSWLPLAAASFVWGPLRQLLGLVASPFFLFFAWYYLGGELSRLGGGLRARQNFRRMLEAAAVNPHDGEAQYQLGLVYQQRRQRTEAIQRFRNAVAIDPTLTDAYLQLGRMAREEGRPREALGYFQTVVDQDERLHSSEVLKELGGLYLTARQYADAKTELEVYVERRPYDPEGLYYYGQVMEATGDPVRAREFFARAVEADRTAPRYRRRFTARWSRLAQKKLRKRSHQSSVISHQ